MTVDQLSRLRFVIFLSSGLITAGYGVLALLMGRPDPIWPWFPTLAALLAIAIIFASSARSGKKVTDASFDELFDHEWRRAVGYSYWIAIAMYPLFIVPLSLGYVESTTAFAAMGTLSGGAPLLVYCFITSRS